MSEDFSARIETADTDTFSLDALKPLLETLGYGNNLLAIEITYGGMPHGATWTTDVYGFDYAALDLGAGTLDAFIGKFVDGRKLSELESTSYGAGEMDDDYDVHEIELSDFEFEGATDAAGWNAYALRVAVDDDGRIKSIQRVGILRMAGGQETEENIEAFPHPTIQNQAVGILKSIDSSPGT